MILTLLAIVFLYLGTVYAAPDVSRSATSPAGPLQQHGLWLPLIIALVLFLGIDAAIFHTRLYESVLKVNSTLGGVALRAQSERLRRPSAADEIAVIGDSRVVQGFSARVANNLTAREGYKFFNLASPGTDPRIWFYLLRDIDPSANRYRAIVIPLKSDDSQEFALMGAVAPGTDISMAAPLVRYSDAFEFATSFPEWSYRYRAFTACFLRGLAYRPDLADFLEHPKQRLLEAQDRARFLETAYQFAGRDEDLTGLSYNGTAQQIIFPPNITPQQRRTVTEDVRRLQTDYETVEQPGYWTQKIVERYAKSRTTTVLFRLPRGALASLLRPLSDDKLLPEANLKSRGAVFLDQRLFTDLERPAYFFDGYHPNATGRKIITERLVSALIQRLPGSGRERSATGSAAGFGSERRRLNPY
jgi:hypothetical protein